MRQHVTAVEAAAKIGGAEVIGNAVGSDALEFHPGTVLPGEYHFAVGTAGSTGLVLQTVLVLANAPSRLVLEGGTHNMLALPFDFIERTFLPVINRMGPKVEARLACHGFYLRGGGRIEGDITPAALTPLECLECSAFDGGTVQVLFTSLPREIADCMIARVRKDLPDWPDDAFVLRELPADQGAGVILMIEARKDQVTEIASDYNLTKAWCAAIPASTPDADATVALCIGLVASPAA